MKTAFAALVWLVALVISPPSEAQQLWSKAEAGMSVEQVGRVFPEAVVPTDPSTLHGGAREELRISHLDVSNTPFRVSFFFAGDMLDQVTLGYTGGGTFALLLLRYESVNTLLRSKYGDEIGSESHRGRLNLEDRDYVSGDTNISNLLLGIGDNEAVWNINYQTRLKQEADKL